MDPDSITQIVAIDGPAGAGKSTVARRVAQRLGYSFLDTGAMYRAATWRAMQHRVDLDDPQAVLDSTRAMTLDMIESPSGLRVEVDGRDVTDAIRLSTVTRNIHKLDRCPGVRTILVDLQRAWGARQPTVAEGRDIGTIVFPKARCKLYMDAAIEERVRRRAEELRTKHVPFDLETLAEDIRERDTRDMTRPIAPLRKAEDAVVIDTTGKTIDDVVDEIVQIARQRLE